MASWLPFNLWHYSPFWALASLKRRLNSSLSSTHLLHSSLYFACVLHSCIHRICDVSFQTMPSYLFLCAFMSSLYCFSCESKDISVQFLSCLDVPYIIAWLNEGNMTVYLGTRIIILRCIWNSYLVQLMKFNFHSERQFFC